jgi:SSS family solute:Na+ symporter
MAQNYWIAIISFSACLLLTIAISLVTQPRPESELHNLVYGFTDVPSEEYVPWFKRPVPLALIVIALLVVVNIMFW